MGWLWAKCTNCLFYFYFKLNTNTMKKIMYLSYFIVAIGYSQTAITDANFQTAINICLSTNPVDGLCSDSEYGAMPGWDVSQVTNMNGAFSNRTVFNADISTWNVFSVIEAKAMFNGSSFNQNIGGWDVSGVTQMRQMFQTTPFNQDIGSWDVSNVTDMYAMFSNANSFNQNISTWNVSNVISMHDLFLDATDFNADISAWDVSNVTNMYRVFGNASAFNQDLSAWDVRKVTDMSFMLNGTALTKENYDALLVGWSVLILQPNVVFSADNIQYCNAGAARQIIILANGWSIEDAGKAEACGTASIEDLEDFSFSVYPNPTESTLYIKGSKNSAIIVIHNTLGKEVLSARVTNTIDVSGLASGVYTIRISEGLRQTISKFIKR